MTTPRRVGQVDARYLTHPTRTHSSGDPCPAGAFPHPAEPVCFDIDRNYVIDHQTIEEAAISAAHRAGYAPDGYYDPNEIAPGVIVDDDDPRAADLDELAVELMAAYADAIERQRDRAQEARTGAAILRGRAFDHIENQQMYGPPCELSIEERREENAGRTAMVRRARARRDYRDSGPFMTRPPRGWPIIRAAALAALAIIAAACSAPAIDLYPAGLTITAVSTDPSGAECLTQTWIMFEDIEADPGIAQMCIPSYPVVDGPMDYAFDAAYELGATDARELDPELLAARQAADPSIAAIVEYIAPNCPDWINEPCYVIARADGTMEPGP